MLVRVVAMDCQQSGRCGLMQRSTECKATITVYSGGVTNLT